MNHISADPDLGSAPLLRRMLHNGSLFWRPAAVAIALLACANGGAAAQKRHRVIAVIADALRFDDLVNSECSALRELADRGSIGMMNCAVQGKRSGPAALLTLAVGQQAASQAGDESAFNDWEAVPGEEGSARAVFMRRIGPLETNIEMTTPEANSGIKHIGISILASRGLDSARLGAALATVSPPVSTWVVGNCDTYVPDRSASLLTVNANGTGSGSVSILRFDNAASFGLIDDPLALSQAAIESQADFIVVQTGDLGRLESARSYLSDQQFHARRADALRRLNILVYALSHYAQDNGADIMLVSPRPVANKARGGAWDRLTPFLAAGPDFAAGLLTSPTTRRIGLIANIDFAPTVLHLFGASIPPAMTGRPINSITTGYDSIERRIAAVDRLDAISGMNEPAKPLLLYPLGIGCFAIIVVGLAARRFAPKAAHLTAPGFVFILGMPVAMLFAPLFLPPTLVEYGLRIVGWGILLTVLSYIVAYFTKLSPALLMMLQSLIVIVVDTLMGQQLQKDSLFCTYAVSGIRYYGVGNEYLGVIVAFALLSAFCLLDESARLLGRSLRPRSLKIASVGFWAALAVLCGWPGLGANAGSLVVTFTAFGAGTMVLRGKVVTWKPVVALSVVGLAVAFLFGAIDAEANGNNSSHNGQAIHAASHGRGLNYLLDIVIRKIELNLHYLVTPAVLGGVIAILLGCWLANLLTREALRNAVGRRAGLEAALRCCGTGALAALVFKDSGVATVDFMAACAMVLTFYYLIIDLEPGSPAGS